MDARTPIENLYNVGDCIRPGLEEFTGMEACAHSAQVVAEMVQRKGRGDTPHRPYRANIFTTWQQSRARFLVPARLG